MVNSNRKGKDGERELANVLRGYGIDGARRGQQHTGLEADDIVGLPGIHAECKRVERLNIDRAMEQAVSECGDNVPAVFHRRNQKKWLVTMRLEDWMDLYSDVVGDDEW